MISYLEFYLLREFVWSFIFKNYAYLVLGFMLSAAIILIDKVRCLMLWTLSPLPQISTLLPPEPGLPADTLSGHRERFYKQYKM